LLLSNANEEIFANSSSNGRHPKGQEQGGTLDAAKAKFLSPKFYHCCSLPTELGTKSVRGAQTAFAEKHGLLAWAQELTKSRRKAWHLSSILYQSLL
jgi:hypothetical protein